MTNRTPSQNAALKLGLSYLGNKHDFDLRTVKNILHGVTMTALALDADSRDLSIVNNAAVDMHVASVMRENQ